MKIKRFEFNMFPENCYVLWDETNEAVVIDPVSYTHLDVYKRQRWSIGTAENTAVRTWNSDEGCSKPRIHRKEPGQHLPAQDAAGCHRRDRVLRPRQRYPLYDRDVYKRQNAHGSQTRRERTSTSRRCRESWTSWWSCLLYTSICV